MKKNKTVAFMLAASLMVGGTFLGTKAWFTDQGTVNNALKLQMGSFGLKVEETNQKTGEGENETVKGWKLVRAVKDEESKNPKVNGNINNEFKMIRPGDVFEREYTITNNGNLDQNIMFVDANPEAATTDDGLFELKVTIKETNESGQELLTVVELEDDMLLKAGNTINVKLELVPIANNFTTDPHSGTKFDFTEILGLNEITIKAKQINAKDYNENTTQIESEGDTTQQ